MANNMTLMNFLQRDPPGFRFKDRVYSEDSTRNVKYENAYITSTSRWTDFNLATIMGTFGHLLNNPNIQIGRDALVITPPPRCGAEDGLREMIAVYADRPVRRALDRTFQFLRSHNQMAGRTAVTLGAGSSARIVDDFVPDRAFYNPNDADPINRLPGEIKPSHKWVATWLEDPAGEARAFMCLRQLSYYMLLQGVGCRHRGTRYGYMLSDQELVAFRKVNAHGAIQFSAPIPWGQSHDGTPRLTVLFSLWYLAMLASSDNDWALPNQPGDPTDEQLRGVPRARPAVQRR